MSNSLRLRPLSLLALISIGSLAYSNSILAESFEGEVTGFEGNMDDVTVVLESRSELRSTYPNNLGEFTFDDVEPGRYFVKVQADGYRTTPARRVDVPNSKEETEPFRLERLNEDFDTFVFHWEEDQSTAGLEYSSNIADPVTVAFLDEPVEIVDSAQAGSLLSKFNVVLVDEEERWTSEHTHRLHEMLTITAEGESYYLKKPDALKSRWLLSTEQIAGDIAVVEHPDGSKDVRIASAAFTNASPKIVEIEGRRGIWYSQRLHHAVVRFVTDFGHNRREVARILNDRYGVRLNPDYQDLTRYTTSETRSSFERFDAHEYVDLINMMEEMPTGFHRIPQLKYVVRRIDGMPHPLYPTAPAVAWPESGYIEFMESAFQQANINDVHRLILHEKAHFLWAHVFDEDTKDAWIELGEWYEDPTTTSGWSTRQTTQFASAYAHLKNPNEDMAESIADFVVNPHVLQARAPQKYEFVRDRLMAGNFYVAKIREDLTFEVYNLYPDYVYPGKIKAVDVRVTGAAEGDKEVAITVDLHALADDQEAAKYVYLRVSSGIDTYFDMGLHPLDTQGNRVRESTRLRGVIPLSKFAKAGYWYPVNVVLTDSAGNSRYQRPNTFEMKIHLNNPLEDYFKPEYVENSLKMNVREASKNVFGIEREIQIINVSWDVDEDNALRSSSPCLVRMVVDVEDTGSYDEYGRNSGDRCSVDFEMPHYMPTGDYSVRYISMIDSARNWGTFTFLRDATEPVPFISLATNNPDSTPPELDVNRIDVTAEPTNPDNPNGETLVEITYRVRDDNAGLFDTGITLRDPQGGKRFNWHKVPDRSSLFSRAKPNEWQELVMTWMLPAGSPPGTWGISSMMVQDKASNEKHHTFTELIHIDVQNNSTVIQVQ